MGKLVLLGVIAFALVANFLGPDLLSGINPGDTTGFLVMLASGALVAEICLLAIWAALGSQAIRIRLPATIALLILGTCAYLAGIQIPEIGELPFEVALFMSVFSLLLFCTIQIPLWAARAIDGRRIDLRAARPLTRAQESTQFGLRYLLGTTALIGVLLSVVKYTVPDRSFNVMITSMLFEVLAVIILFVGLSALVCLPCVRLALTERLHVASLVWLCSAFLIGPIVVMAGLFATLGAGPDSMEVWWLIECFCLGLAGTILSCLLVARWHGQRLHFSNRSITDSQPAPSDVAKSVTSSNGVDVRQA